MTARFRFVATVLAVVIALTTAWMLYERERPTRITIAAGPVNGESFAIAEAIAQVLERHTQGIEVAVLETGGTAQNLALLGERTVDLATVQANIPPVSTARLVATLYPDAFQLVARSGTGIDGVASLAGHKVAIPPAGSGGHESFWFLTDHYGLSDRDLEALPMTTESANWAMLSGAVEATFRVRAPGNPSVRQLIETSPSNLVPIPQAGAMGLKQPALVPGTIVVGAYRGHPPLPEVELPTVVAAKVLVADEDTPDAVVNTLTQLLFERRRELLDRTSLAGFISPPEQAGGTFLPVHPGAQRYYDRDEPGFIQENAEPIALGISVLVLLGSGLLQIASHRKQRRIDEYNNRVLLLFDEIRRTDDRGVLVEQHARLMDILGDVVDDAEEGRVTPEGFDLFSVTFEAVSQALRDRLRWAARDRPEPHQG